MQEKLKNPLFYGENRTAAHSDHKYYVSEAEFAQNIQSLKKRWTASGSSGMQKIWRRRQKDFIKWTQTA